MWGVRSFMLDDEMVRAREEGEAQAGPGRARRRVGRGRIGRQERELFDTNEATDRPTRLNSTRLDSPFDLP